MSYEHFARVFKEPHKFLLYWNGMSPSRAIQEDWVTVVDVTDEEDMPEDADDTGEIPTSGHEHSIGGGMPPMPERSNKEVRQNFAEVAEIIRSRVEQDEHQKDDRSDQMDATAAEASTVTTLALINEYPPCIFESVIPVECVEPDGAYFTSRLVGVMGEFVKWRQNWENKTRERYLEKARGGWHPFAPGQVEPWDPVDGTVPYEPIERGVNDFWTLCDKIMQWTQKACLIPLSFWRGAGKEEDKDTAVRGNAYTRALANYKAVRVVYKVSKIQYADATYFEKQPDTFYVPPYFFFATARKYSAEVLARMDAFG